MIEMNVDLVGELRTKESTLSIVCRKVCQGVHFTTREGSGVLLPGLFSLEGKIIGAVNPSLLGQKFLAVFEKFLILMIVRTDCSVVSDGAPTMRISEQ